jgi:hypothetical protein
MKGKSCRAGGGRVGSSQSVADRGIERWSPLGSDTITWVLPQGELS